MISRNKFEVASYVNSFSSLIKQMETINNNVEKSIESVSSNDLINYFMSQERIYQSVTTFNELEIAVLNTYVTLLRLNSESVSNVDDKLSNEMGV